MYWCWHNWSKWKAYRYDGIRLGERFSETKQARICLKCNIEEHRLIPYAHGALYAVNAMTTSCAHTVQANYQEKSGTPTNDEEVSGTPTNDEEVSHG